MKQARFLYADVYRYARPPTTSVARTPRTSLFLVQQPLQLPVRVPLYHVAVLGVDRFGRREVFEHGPWRARMEHAGYSADDAATVLTRLPGVETSLDAILEYEATLPRRYILGVRDCRHHVSDLLKWCYNNAH